MTIDFHSDRAGGRAVGQPRTGRMGPGRDPILVAREARRLIQSGHWQRLGANSDREKILTLLRARLPAALSLVPTAALFALGKQPPAGGCHWCAALVQQLPDRAELDRTPVNLALLGEGCRRCQHRWQVDARVAALIDEAREEARLAAGRPRTPEQDVTAPTASLPPLTAATPPYYQRRPWPPPVQPARVPDPHYYTRLPWPPEDTP
jgi:hypothetical protein